MMRPAETPLTHVASDIRGLARARLLDGPVCARLLVGAVRRDFPETSLHSLDCPEEIDGRGPCSSQCVRDLFELLTQFGDIFRFAVANTESDTHGGRNANGWSAADNHYPDGFGDFLVRFEDGILFECRQLALIDHHDAVFSPFNGLK